MLSYTKSNVVSACTLNSFHKLALETAWELTTSGQLQGLDNVHCSSLAVFICSSFAIIIVLYSCWSDQGRKMFDSC